MGDIQERSAKENLNSFERKTFVRKEKNDALDRYKGRGEKEQVMPHLLMRLFMIINLLFPVLQQCHLTSVIHCPHLHFQSVRKWIPVYQKSLAFFLLSVCGFPCA